MSTLAVVLVLGGALGVTQVHLKNLGQSPEPSTTSKLPTPPSTPFDIGARGRNALTGEWQTSSYPSARVRSAIAAAGLAAADADYVLENAGHWRVQMTFSQNEGNPALIVVTSDPSNPGASM